MSPSSVSTSESTAESSVTWSISIDWMLHPTLLVMVVTSATTPGRSSMGMRTSSRRSVHGSHAAGSARRASAASASRLVSVARSPASSASANCPMMPCISRKPPKSASLLSKAIPHHSSGEPAAMRVESLNPPAARRMSESWPFAWRTASCTRELAVKCGTWLTTATAASCCSRGKLITRAPIPVISSCRRVKCSAGVSASGHKIQYAPLNRSARAPTMPFFSEPAIGCPGTKFCGYGRVCAAISIMRHFVEAVSVMMPR